MSPPSDSHQLAQPRQVGRSRGCNAAPESGHGSFDAAFGAALSCDIVRVVVDGRAATSAHSASAMLLEAFGSRWPSSTRAKFTITPAGFVVGTLPPWTGGVGWNSRPSDMQDLVAVAEPWLDLVMTPSVRLAVANKTNVLAIGIDLVGHGLHAELIALVDLVGGAHVHWTGKSYPTTEQQARLVQVAELSSHLIDAAGERVLALGCDDLYMFSARVKANQAPAGERRDRCDRMRELTAAFAPSIVLHHGRAADTHRTWFQPWAQLTGRCPSVRSWASALCYHRSYGKEREPLDVVRMGTASQSGVHDVVVAAR